MVGVDVAHVAELRGLPDVAYDFGVSTAVHEAFNAAASALRAQAGERASLRQVGLGDFAGHFSRVFKANGDVQLADLDEVADNLHEVALRINELEAAAKAENERRRVAREWAARVARAEALSRQSDYLGLNNGGGEYSKIEPPPAVSIAESGPMATVPATTPAPRRTPAAGSSGASGGGSLAGVSSARPSSLCRFASGSREADEALQGRPALWCSGVSSSRRRVRGPSWTPRARSWRWCSG